MVAATGAAKVVGVKVERGVASSGAEGRVGAIAEAAGTVVARAVEAMAAAVKE